MPERLGHLAARAQQQHSMRVSKLALRICVRRPHHARHQHTAHTRLLPGKLDQGLQRGARLLGVPCVGRQARRDLGHAFWQLHQRQAGRPCCVVAKTEDVCAAACAAGVDDDCIAPCVVV
jgi:hypothetical protein